MIRKPKDLVKILVEGAKASDSFEEIKKIAEDHDDKPLKKKEVEFDPEKLVRPELVKDSDDNAAKIKAALAWSKGRKYVITTIENSYVGDDEDFFDDLEKAKAEVDKCDEKAYVNEIDVINNKDVVAKKVYENKVDLTDATEATKEGLAELEKALYESLKDISFEYVDSEIKAEGLYEITIAIEWGDWKHDHLAADHLLEEWCDANGYKVINASTTTTEENGSDCYSALHTYTIKKNEPEKVETNDSFEEIDKAMKKPNGKPLKRTEIEIDPEAVQVKKIVADSRGYIGEYNEYFYEHYRGVNVYKKAEDKYEAEVLGKMVEGKTPEETRDLIDEVIKNNVEEYSKKAEVKPVSITKI